MSVYTILGLIAIGIAAGTLSSLVGIGGGIVIVPALVMGYGLSQHTAQGTTLALLSMPVALVAAYNYHKAGHVNWWFAVVLGIGFILGGFFGSKIALSVSPSTIKKIFAVLLVIISIKLWRDASKGQKIESSVEASKNK